MKRFNIINVCILLVLHFNSCKKETSCEICTSSNNNNPPIANAGPDQIITLPTDSVLLDGRTSSDPDGRISSYLWIKISGPSSFNIGNASVPNTVVKNLNAGVYQFELKVTDDQGQMAKDTMVITVNSFTANASCFVNNLKWSVTSNGLMTLINTASIAGTLDCAGYGAEVLIPSHYDVWIQFEGSPDWLRLSFIPRDSINVPNVPDVFLSSVIYNDPTGNDGPASVPVVYAKPASGIDHTKGVNVRNGL